MSNLPASRDAQAGVTLMELLVVISIIGILAGIAIPSYQKSVSKTRRRAAEACLSNYAGFMERFYTSNLRYDVDVAGTAVALPAVDCASAANTGNYYDYRFSGAVAQAAYMLQAIPKTGSGQDTKDAQCGTLTLDQTGARGASGAGNAAAIAACW
ncbi:MAG: type IV pilin protein [Pseudomonadota bacterium]